MKHLSIILTIIFLFTTFCFAKPIEKRSFESYTMENYFSFLSNVLVPEINEYISKNPIKEFNEENGRKLINGIIHKVITPHVAAGNILIRPYKVPVVAIPGEQFINYFLIIPITFIQYDKNGNLPVELTVKMTFFCGKDPITKLGKKI